MHDTFTLVLDRRDMTVTMDGRALCTQGPGEPKRHIPLGLIGNVVVYGRPMVACDVWRAFARRGIPAVLLPARGAGEAAWLGAGFTATSQLRRMQYRVCSAPAACLEIARRIVDMKLSAQSRLVEHLRRVSPFEGMAGSAAFDDVQRAVDTAKDNVAAAPTASALMGHEGAAAKAWFGCLAAVLPRRWKFTGRNRRPPADPVNALLSLTYTLTGLEALNAGQAAGLDPTIGFLHHTRPGRNALALDLLETQRPAAELVVLEMLAGALGPAHFCSSRQSGCRLTKAGRRLYYQGWARHRARWPDFAARHGLNPEGPIPYRTLPSCSRRATGEICRAVAHQKCG